MKPPLPDDFSLPASEFERVRTLVDNAERLRKTLSEGFFMATLPVGIALGAVAGGVFGLLAAALLYVASWFYEDSRRLLDLTNKRDRKLIDAFRRFELASGRFVNWQIKTFPVYWTSRSDNDFVVEVADLFRAWDFQVEIISKSHDRRVDMLVVRGMRVSAVRCIQQHGPVSRSEAREFLFAMYREDVKEGFLVSTGGFSPQARRLVREHPIAMVELIDVEDLCQLKLGVPWNMEFRKQPEKKDDRFAEAARQMDLIVLRFTTNRLSGQDAFALLDQLSDDVSRIGMPMTVDTEAETAKGPRVVDRLADFKTWLRSVEDRGHASAMFAFLIGWAAGGSIMMLGVTLTMVATAPGIVVMFGGVGVLVWLN